VRLTGDEAAVLVRSAAAGDRTAWESLVDGYSGLIWAIARNHRLSAGDAADVSQTTWLRLLEHIDRLNNPTRVGAWLATTARRESLRLQARSKRTVLVGEEWDFKPDPAMAAQVPEVDEDLLRAERDEALAAALDQLPPRCQALMRLLLVDPPPSYEEVSSALDMPIGSIGPTRGRCLEKLRLLMDGSGIEAHSIGSS